MKHAIVGTAAAGFALWLVINAPAIAEFIGLLRAVGPGFGPS
jgi:hypothetical protein